MFSCCHDKHDHHHAHKLHPSHNDFCDDFFDDFFDDRCDDFHGHRRHFERPFVLSSSVPRNRQTGVNPNIKAIKLILTRSNDHDHRGFGDVCTEIDMWQNGNRVPIRIRRQRHDGCGERRVILVIPINPLKGGTQYKIRIKSFFIDRCGEKVTKFSLIVFTTGCRS